MMIVVPAIDILNRKVVRTEHGSESTAKVYSENPLEIAKFYFESGARIVHIVDLDSAIHRNEEMNQDIIEEILSNFSKKMKVQVAGGIRSKDQAMKILSKGAFRVVIGSIAYSDPNIAKSILDSLGPNRVVLALDYDESGKVRTQGWVAKQDELVLTALQRNFSLGFDQFLLTSIAKDGMLSGPDFKTLEKSKTLLSYKNRKPTIIASGGIVSKSDLSALMRLQIDEVVVGKAILEGELNATEIFSLYDR